MFSNEIDDLPAPGIYVKKKFFETPAEIQKELDKDKSCKEADFRRWLIKNKPKGAVMTPIETSTAVGVPDIFCCYNGFSSWIECKVILAGSPRFRGTQYSYLKKLVEAGGHAKVVVQRLNNNNYKPSSIWVFNAADIVSIPSGMFKVQGQDMLFPPDVKPYYIWYYNRNKECDIKDLYSRLLLDISDFKW